MAEQSDGLIRGYHAHVYFDADEVTAARVVCEGLRDAIGVPMGRMHAVAVGPHPRGSCQLAFRTHQLAPAIEWLLRHRAGFTVFLHGLSGDELRDHTAFVMWLGDSEPLDLSALD